MYKIKNKIGYSENFKDMDALKVAIKESFELDGKDSLEEIEVFDENDNCLEFSFETKINIGSCGSLTIKE